MESTVMLSGAVAARRNTAKTEGVRTEWKIVTPEQARKWLEGKVHNRAVKDPVVARYAADMRCGRWKQTHQGIAFDDQDTLIDGQHRLFAITEADVPVVLQVTTGLARESQHVMDDGLKRSLVDILKINGKGMADLTALHAAVSRRMQLGLAVSHEGVSTRQHQGMFLQAHWDAIHFAVSLCPPRKRLRGVTNASTIAAVARASNHESKADLERFVEVLISGITKNDRETTIIILRNWLMTRPYGTGGSSAAVEAYAKTVRAIQIYCKGVSLRGKLYAATEDYALPRGK